MDIRTTPVEQLRQRRSGYEVVAVYEQFGHDEDSTSRCFVLLKDKEGDYDTTTCDPEGHYYENRENNDDDIISITKDTTDTKVLELEKRIAVLERRCLQNGR